MPLSTQAKILRVLQERSFERVGGEEKISVDVRVICATNRNLEEAVQKGTFRMDLFYRINTIGIEISSLRERKSDIAELARHFLARANRSGKQDAQAISEAAMEVLRRHSWPGNVRELQNAIERAVIICNEETIQPAHLPPAVLRVSPQPGGDKTGQSLIDAVEQMERSMILSTLERYDWTKAHAARALGITERILSYKMQNLGIERPRLEN